MVGDESLNEEYLSHHGIKGQKWGVRRFQNPDGTLTEAGKARRSDDGEKKSGLNKEMLKKVGKAALITGGVTVAAYAYANNAQAVNAVIGSMASKAISSNGMLSAIANDAAIDGIGRTLVTLGKDYVGKQVKDLPAKALHDVIAPAAKKVVIGAAQGVVISATTKALNKTFGEENVEAAKQAYNAYNKKNKIGRVPDLFGKNRINGEDDYDE